MKRRPNTAASRAIRAGAMGAKTAGSYLGYLAQAPFLGADKRAGALSETHRKVARRVSDEMLDMRGPLMKLGQTLSLHTDSLPAETLEELSRLQMRAPGMHPSLVYAQFRGCLGKDPDDVFAEFDPGPFAAASLGQVHHARLPNGDVAAVKIQYPGIRDAIDGDFKWFRAAATPARLSRHLPGNVIDEMHTQILAEMDYVREADNTVLFAKQVASLGFVEVPKIHRRLSGDRVITMSRLAGEHLDLFLERNPSQKLRDLVGAHLMELYYHQVIVMEALHADPHWGNYLFRTDGSIGLVDFGCVKFLPKAFADNMRATFLYPGPHDAPEFHVLMEQRYGAAGVRFTPAIRRSLIGFVDEFYTRMYPADANASHRFDFADEKFLAAYLKAVSGIWKARGSLPEYVFLGRAEVGLYQTLHRLRARVPTTAIIRRCLDAAARSR